ncbi:hypothetical protein OROMI_001554 [Orobanche minor]
MPASPVHLPAPSSVFFFFFCYRSSFSTELSALPTR